MNSEQGRLLGERIAQIDGFEKFSFWFAGFKAQLLADPDKRDVYEESENPQFVLELDDCPWDTVPEPLRAIIEKAYPSAVMPEEKAVRGAVLEEAISLSLESPHIEDGIERIGESYDPELELGLQDFGTYRRGQWKISSRSIPQRMSEMNILDELQGPQNVAEIIDRLRKLPPPSETYEDPTPPQLQALAQFFHGNADKFSVVQI